MMGVSQHMHMLVIMGERLAPRAYGMHADAE